MSLRNVLSILGGLILLGLGGLKLRTTDKQRGERVRNHMGEVDAMRSRVARAEKGRIRAEAEHAKTAAHAERRANAGSGTKREQLLGALRRRSGADRSGS